MTYFMNRYVIEQAIPIPTLLYAFGVCLVSAQMLLFVVILSMWMAHRLVSGTTS